jgi:hypothetical protein
VANELVLKYGIPQATRVEIAQRWSAKLAKCLESSIGSEVISFEVKSGEGHLRQGIRGSCPSPRGGRPGHGRTDRALRRPAGGAPVDRGARQEAADGGEKREMEVKHTFLDGVYMRELFIPKGTLLVGKPHKLACVNVVSKGDISVLTESGSARVKAGLLGRLAGRNSEGRLRARGHGVRERVPHRRDRRGKDRASDCLGS